MIEFRVPPSVIAQFRERVDYENFWQQVHSLLPHVPRRQITWDQLHQSASSDQLAKLNISRRAFVDIVSSLYRQICAPFCQISESGTIAPSSDVDISLLYVRPLPVLQFTRWLTQQIWGRGIHMENLFDMNVYAHVWYVQCDKELQLFENCADRNYRDIDSRIPIRQIAWSLLRVYQYRRSFSHIKDWYKQLPTELQSQVKEVQKHIREWKKEHRTTALDTAIANMQRTQAQLPNAQIDYFDATSLVAYLQREAYYSIGAYEHVVVLLQKKYRIQLPPWFFVASFFDNLGFLLEAAPSKTPKYFYRCVDALRHLGYKDSRITEAYTLAKSYHHAKKMGDSSRTEIATTELRKLIPDQTTAVEFLLQYVDATKPHSHFWRATTQLL